MKKYVLKQTGEEVVPGMVIVGSTTNEVGMLMQQFSVMVTEKNIPTLLEEGILEEMEVECGENSCPTINQCIEQLAERIGWSSANLTRYLSRLSNISASSVFAILLREFAIIMDQKYPDHIENSTEIWAISNTSGKIVRVKKDTITTYKNFAAFRTVEDAILAKKVFAEMTKTLFCGKQKGKKRQSM